VYCSYFGFTQKPFDISTNPNFLYMTKSHKSALSYMSYGIKQRAGFLVLTGEVGSGKTTILKHLIGSLLSREDYALIYNPMVSSEQILMMINEEFGLGGRGQSKAENLFNLQQFLLDKYEEGRQPILIIDEAQNLSIETLEELRMLTNLESSEQRLLQIILAGQPELRNILNNPKLRQISQRVAVSYHLQPLSPREVVEYIAYRLEKAGNRNAVRFTRKAIELLCEKSCGIPRVINHICNYVLLAAFTERIRDIGDGLVREIVNETAVQYMPGQSALFNGEPGKSRFEVDGKLARLELLAEDLMQQIKDLRQSNDLPS